MNRAARRLCALALAGALLRLSDPAAAQTPAPSAPPSRVAPAPDYRSDAAWLCRPGRQDACAGDVSTRMPDGRIERFEAAAAPAVDCFYVYPTVSNDPTVYSDLAAGEEEAAVALRQAARLRTRCRVFGPVYRQFTLAGLTHVLSGRGGAPNWTTPYADVRAAWRDYLERDNGGRGVVLIGHSQGAILLARLLADEVDVHPGQRRRLVSAILAGHIGLPETGGLGSIPFCRTRRQTGCAVVFASYADDDAAPARFYGRVASGRAACVNPARPEGGSAPLNAFFSKAPDAPADAPPFLAASGQLTARCVTDPLGSVMRVSVTPGEHAAALRQRFARYGSTPGWGLHQLDLSLVGGDVLELVGDQSRAWRSRRAH